LPAAGRRHETTGKSVGDRRRLGQSRQEARQTLLPGKMPAALGAGTQVGFDALAHMRRKFLTVKEIQLVSHHPATHKRLPLPENQRMRPPKPPRDFLTVTDFGEGDFATCLPAGLAPAEERFDG